MVNMSNIKKGPILAILISAAFVAILNQTLLVTAIPHIMKDLGITANTAQWLSTVFMLVNGIMIPITAFLIGKFTTRKLLMGSMILFLIGTIIAAVSPNFTLLMIGRVFQAAGAGIVMPLMQTILLLIYPVEKRGVVMGMVGLVIAFAPAIGPSLSGWIVDVLPWRSLFYVVIPIALIDLIATYFLMKNVTKLTNPKLDLLSIILSTLGFGGLLYGFSIAGSSGWGSKEVIISLAVGAIALIWFIMRQLKLKDPILEFRVFKNPIFTLTTIISSVVFIAMISAETILPIYIQNMLGYTALQSGLMLLPGAIIMGIMSPIIGKIFDKIGARLLSIIGLSIVAITTIMFSNLTVESTLSYLTVLYAIRMFGLSMVMMPTQTAGLNVLSNKLIPHGTAMANTMRMVTASIGTAILVTVMTNSAQNSNIALPLESMVYGVNKSFLVASILVIIGLILSFFLKGTNPRLLKKNEDNSSEEMSAEM